VSKCFSKAPHIKSHSAAFMLPETGVPLAVIWTWCMDCAAGPEAKV